MSAVGDARKRLQEQATPADAGSTPDATKSSGEVVDLLAALQKAVTAAKESRADAGSTPQKGRECGWMGCGHPDCDEFCTPDAGSTQDDRDAPELVIDGGWLCEVANKHTCGTAASGYYGAHEPGCGLVPIADIRELLAEHDQQVAAKAWDEGNAACCEPAYVHLNPYRADRIEGDS